jgi:phage major head subunit gpT-like protein
MALTKSDIPDLLLPGLKAEFELAYRAQVDDSVANQIATVINTSLPAQKYAWLGATPPMREFVDERRPGGMASYSVTIEDKVFESTIAVDRRAIEDDQLDLIRLRVRDLAGRVSAHRHQIVVESLLNGDTGTGYDGVPLFSNSHPQPDGSALDNLSTDALSSSSLAAGMAAMMAVPDDTGTPLGVVPDTLLVGPAQMWNAIELVESPVVVFKGDAVAGKSPTPYVNAFQGRLKLVVSPYIRGDREDAWFLLDTQRAIKGVILQQREDVPVEFSALEANSGSESAWMRDRYHYGVRARYNVGYGLWQAAYAGGMA